jgi:hypothetical protein
MLSALPFEVKTTIFGGLTDQLVRGFASPADVASFRMTSKKNYASKDSQKELLQEINSSIEKKRKIEDRLVALQRDRSEKELRLVQQQASMGISDEAAALRRLTLEQEAAMKALRAIENKLSVTNARWLSAVRNVSRSQVAMSNILHMAGRPMYLSPTGRDFTQFSFGLPRTRTYMGIEDLHVDVPGIDTLTIQNIREPTLLVQHIRAKVELLDHMAWTRTIAEEIAGRPASDHILIGILKYLMIVAPLTTDEELLATAVENLLHNRSFSVFGRVFCRMAPELVDAAFWQLSSIRDLWISAVVTTKPKPRAYTDSVRGGAGAGSAGVVDHPPWKKRLWSVA